MFIELTRKDTGKPAAINVSNIETFNVDDDGVGTMIVLKSGTVRPVKECYESVKKAVRKAHC